MTTAEKPRNVHQRKLAVMRACKAIKPDKTHPHHKFEYVSIQNLENHLREMCADAGLDVTPSIEGAELVLTLTNVDTPEDQIVTRWPVVDGDKGWAYTTKYPLMRLFHVGDGDEADEADMASRSAHTASTPRPSLNGAAGSSTSTSQRADSPAASPPSASGRRVSVMAREAVLDGAGRRRACPDCGDGLIELVVFSNGNRQLSCTNWRTCKHREDVPDDVRILAPQGADAGDVDPDDIPF